MVNWKNLIENADTKGLEEFSVFRESDDSDTKHMLHGLAVSKKSQKAYNITCYMDTEHFTETTKMQVNCNCDDFKFRCAYVLFRHGALLAPQNFVLTPPKVMNPDETLKTCKHIKLFLILKEKMLLNKISKAKDQI